MPRESPGCSAQALSSRWRPKRSSAPCWNNRVPLPRKPRLKASEYIHGVLASDRIKLAQAITVIESDLESDLELAEQILDGVLPHTGQSRRVGITGTPGA